jgi:formate hydrogenlyase subunit 3/multisubunit Na+/H+ antiporter MnhD subunit
MGGSGVVLLAASLAEGEAAAIVGAGGVSWILAMAVLMLGDGLRRAEPWWSIPSLIGALALLGAPLTPGFVAGAALLRGLAGGESLGLGGGFFLGILFLIPALGRWLLSAPSAESPDRRGPLVARAIGLGLPSLFLVVAGLFPSVVLGAGSGPSVVDLLVSPGLAGWLLWIVVCAVGGVFAWQDGNLRARLGLLLEAAHDLLRLEWLYEVVVGALGRGLGVLRATDEVMGGAGALLWSLVLFLLILLVGGRL